MSAIAGCWSQRQDGLAQQCCARMLEAQTAYGPHDLALTELGPVAAGRCLYRLLPEDRFDRQPLIGESGRFLLVADIRIDNRGELAGALDIGTAA